ncbi:MAG TPA: site-specific integrase [Caulobacteraceae bacterium]
MRRKLTDEMVQEIQATGGNRVEIFDKIVPALAVRVTPAGAKTYVVRGRVKGQPNPIRVTIGNANGMEIEEARTAASDMLKKLRAGKDPRADRKDQEAIADRLQWERVAETFIDKHAKKNRTWKQTETYLAHWVTPHWKGQPISAVTRSDVATILDAVEDATSPANANRVLAAVRKLFNWAIVRGLIDTSPIAKGMARSGEIKRDRFLNFDEVAAVWKAADSLGHPFGPWFKLLLATGQRRGEVAGATWASLDLEKERVWTLTPEETKAKRAHLVPLSPLALQIIEAQPKIGKPPVYVFTTNGRPISGYAYAKRAIDAELAKAGKGLPQWRIHDLRRTVATHMEDALGIPPHVVGSVLNHATAGYKGVTAIYTRGDLIFERRRALVAWARLLTLAIEGGKVWQRVATILRPETEAEAAQTHEFRRMIQAGEETWESYRSALTENAPAGNVRPMRGAA